MKSTPKEKTMSNESKNTLEKQVHQVSRKDDVARVFDDPRNTERLLAYFDGNQNEAIKFKQTVMLLAMDRELIKCTPESIFKASLACAQIGLSPHRSMKQAWFVSYFDKDRNVWDVQLQIGTVGWHSLGLRSGKFIKSHTVYNCDEFDFSIEDGEDKIHFKPNWEKRKEDDSKWVFDELHGVAVYVFYPDLGTKLVKFVPANKLKQIRANNQAVKKGKYSPWSEWAAEMFETKGIKYVLSKLPMDEKTALAIEVENKLEALNKALLPKHELSAIEADIAKETGADVVDVQSDDIENQEPDDFVASTGPNPFLEE